MKLFLQWAAKEAKRRVGDVSRHWSVLGTLHDAQVWPNVTRG